MSFQILKHQYNENLYNTRRYGPLCGPSSSSCKGLRPWGEFFLVVRAKKNVFFMLLWPIFGLVWCPVVTFITFSSSLIFFYSKTIKKNTKKHTQNKYFFFKSSSPPKKKFFKKNQKISIKKNRENVKYSKKFQTI